MPKTTCTPAVHIIVISLVHTLLDMDMDHWMAYELYDFVLWNLLKMHVVPGNRNLWHFLVSRSPKNISKRPVRTLLS